MTTRIPTIALAASAVIVASADFAHAQGRRGGGFVGNRGGSARPAIQGSPSFSHPAQNQIARPANPIGGGGNRANLGANVSPGNINRPGNSVGAGGNRPALGGGQSPGPSTRPAPAPGGQPARPNLGANGPSSPNWGGNRPGNGMIGQRPGGNFNRPQLGDNLGVAHRPNLGGNIGGGNRTIGGGNTNINRPTNINTNINRPTNVQSNVTNNNVTNITNTTVNRATYAGNRYGPGYGGWGGGYRGWGGGYGYGAGRYAAYHRGWVNGFWNSHYLPGGGWGNSALGWGVGIGVAAWGIGSLFNTWGYSSFVNPYYTPAILVQQPAVVVQQPTVVTQPVVYDYSRPLDLASPPPDQPVVDQSVDSFENARAAFKAGDYASALKLSDNALTKTPNDPILHEFRAMCLFALNRYDEAAAPMYTVLSAGPGWDWTTLAGLYPSVDVYSKQLRSLEAYCDSNRNSASARFLLAALYMTQGSTEAAAGVFKQVVALQPQDRLSAELVDFLTRKPEAELAENQPAARQPGAGQVAVNRQVGQVVDNQPAQVANNLGPSQTSAGQPGPAANSGATQPATGTGDQGPPLPQGPVPAELVGSWSASPAKDVTIALALNQNSGFSWKVTDRGQTREFAGRATFDNGTLALAPPDQPPMVGSVSRSDDGHFVFKAMGGPPNDPGLAFGKS
jgi:thioredoxin-like negative regulator of GroEL